jgi:hypothetical protein
LSTKNESFDQNSNIFSPDQSKFYENVSPSILTFMQKAKDRIYSLSAGNRIAKIVPFIMRVGFAKVLFAANTLGVDTDQNKSFIVFSPDGTCTYNAERLKRGFSYGSIIKSDFNGLISASNSMPNGCGFSIYKITDDLTDQERSNLIERKQKELGKDQLYHLSKGNHFAGLYKVLDPVSGEDTNDRFVVVHCSGHSGTQFLYTPESWLTDVDGFHKVITPHGAIHLLEGEAKKRYIEKSKEGEKINADNRTGIMNDVFGENQFKTLEAITHQGISSDGYTHLLGVQIHDGLQPIAFNAEEGLIAVKAKKSFSKEFLETLDYYHIIKSLNLDPELQHLNFTPHGAGYEFKHEVDSFKISLNGNGISHLDLNLIKSENGVKNTKLPLTFDSFRSIRDNMTYRRKFAVLREIFKADLIDHKFDLWPQKAIYPLVSIPGGQH